MSSINESHAAQRAPDQDGEHFVQHAGEHESLAGLALYEATSSTEAPRPDHDSTPPKYAYPMETEALLNRINKQMDRVWQAMDAGISTDPEEYMPSPAQQQIMPTHQPCFFANIADRPSVELQEPGHTQVSVSGSHYTPAGLPNDTADSSETVFYPSGPAQQWNGMGFRYTDSAFVPASGSTNAIPEHNQNNQGLAYTAHPGQVINQHLYHPGQILKRHTTHPGQVIHQRQLIGPTQSSGLDKYYHSQPMGQIPAAASHRPKNSTRATRREAGKTATVGKSGRASPGRRNQPKPSDYKPWEVDTIKAMVLADRFSLAEIAAALPDRTRDGVEHKIIRMRTNGALAPLVRRGVVNRVLSGLEPHP